MDLRLQQGLRNRVMVQNRKEVCMSADEKRADLGSFSDRTGYNNKMIFLIVCFMFVFLLFCFLVGGVIIHSIENVHSCGWNSSYLLR